MARLIPAQPDIDMPGHPAMATMDLDPVVAPVREPIGTLIAAMPTPARKRKKGTGEDNEPPGPSEPRRLRRSHEACARCRSKKIKCDSKHPKCTACTTAGVQCNQEDRHRQTLTPRGHTEKVERQIVQCVALLKHHIPDFELEDIEKFLQREGIDVEPSLLMSQFQFTPPAANPPNPPIKGFPYNHPLMNPYGHVVNPGYPHLSGGPYPPLVPPSMYNPHIHPAFQHPPPPPLPPPPPPHPTETRPLAGDIKGQDPQSNDMSNAQALAKNFGVSPAIVHDLKLAVMAGSENEDLAVGSGGLSSGRDRDVTEVMLPRNPAEWIPFKMQRRTAGPVSNVDIWLPKDRPMVRVVADNYFRCLDWHRPVFNRNEFEEILDALYSERPVWHDPGYVCGLYLVLALGTMSLVNKKPAELNQDPEGINIPDEWPQHEEFFQRALAIKPDLRVTISSLQALILLQWYLYTERQGRSLWRLVGSLVRLAIELGLHHDPTQQPETFTEEECQLRINLWAIVMMHDRGTSILLGRPLGIAPSDANTPYPPMPRGNQQSFSEHFLYSGPMVEIQADIINSLYSPTRQSPETIMRHANRIMKSMAEFRKGLPEPYKYYFGGTEDWPPEKRRKLVEAITEDQGLTLLKLGIARILLLRALFSSKDLPYAQRYTALVDAIITSHNVILVHYQLIKYPDIAFFVSPIPLHIAAMVILYGHMSKCDRLSREVALEDIWMALDMLPSLRWKWERKDYNGAHPLIARLAEKVFDIQLQEVGYTGQCILLPEFDWESDSPVGTLTPTSSQPNMNRLPVPYGNNSSNGYTTTSPPSNGKGKAKYTEANGKNLVDLPPVLFWPYDPQNPVDMVINSVHMNRSQNPRFTASIGSVDCLPSQESFVLEEKDTTVTDAHMQKWITAIDQEQISSFIGHPQTQMPQNMSMPPSNQ